MEVAHDFQPQVSRYVMLMILGMVLILCVLLRKITVGPRERLAQLSNRSKDKINIDSLQLV